MPSNVIGSSEDESKWQRAKRIAQSKYDVEPGTEAFYRRVMGVYKRMDPDGLDKEGGVFEVTDRGTLKLADDTSSGSPPNYRRANGDLRCANCQHYSGGYCEAYNQSVRDDYVCEDWKDTGDRDL
ncbi:MAG: hypothetical protein ABEN55_14715, partial [Bradymonadaceae bacterium]